MVRTTTHVNESCTSSACSVQTENLRHRRPRDGRGVHSFDPKTESWSRHGSMSTARYSFGACVLGEYIYAVGGGGSPLTSPVGRRRSVEKYDATNDEWSPVMPMNHARAVHAVACTGGKVYAIGGFDGKMRSCTENRINNRY